MSRGVAMSLLATFASAQPGLDYATLWSKFQSDFGKSYKGVGEGQRRFEIFRANLDVIYSENTKNMGYKLGVNEFSDLTSEEFAAGYMGYQQPKASVLYGGAPFLGNHTWDGEALPSSVDWSMKGAVTSVKNQQQCGSCWTFSATGALEGAYQIATGSLVSLSEQQIVDCDHNLFPPTAGCSGGSMSAAFTYAQGVRLCTETSYPYEAKNGKCRIDACTTGIEKGRVTGYKGLAWIARIIPASEETMMSAVAQQPVSVAIEADKDVFHHYSSGVVDGDCGQMPDHGVLVVGYGTDSKLGDYWKVKNSWGKTWGEAGYVRVKRGAGGKGECSILGSPSYPVISKAADIVV